MEPQQPTAKVQVMERRPGSLKVQVEADQPGQLVVRDLNLPGWEVTVERQVEAARSGLLVDAFDGDSAEMGKSGDSATEGRPSTVEMADFRRMVSIPAGSSVVSWHYQPKSVWYGAILSLGTGLCLLLWQMGTAWRRRGDRRRA